MSIPMSMLFHVNTNVNAIPCEYQCQCYPISSHVNAIPCYPMIAPMSMSSHVNAILYHPMSVPMSMLSHVNTNAISCHPMSVTMSMLSHVNTNEHCSPCQQSQCFIPAQCLHYSPACFLSSHFTHKIALTMTLSLLLTKITPRNVFTVNESYRLTSSPVFSQSQHTVCSNVHTHNTTLSRTLPFS